MYKTDPSADPYATPGSARASGPTVTPTQGKAARPAVSETRKLRYYDLDNYLHLRDPLLVIGFGLVVYGVGCFSVPASVILAGLGLMAVSGLMAQ